MIESNNSSENKEVKIRKVPIEAVLSLLGNLYNNGVDFVDLHGRIGIDEDVLGISFSKDYMDPEYAEGFEDMDGENLSNDEIKTTKLSDDDINALL